MESSWVTMRGLSTATAAKLPELCAAAPALDPFLSCGRHALQDALRTLLPEGRRCTDRD